MLVDVGDAGASPLVALAETGIGAVHVNVRESRGSLDADASSVDGVDWSEAPPELELDEFHRLDPDATEAPTEEEGRGAKPFCVHSEAIVPPVGTTAFLRPVALGLIEQ